MGYYYECGQVLNRVYLPVNDKVDRLQPAYYCMNRECKMMGIVTVLRESEPRKEPK